MGTTQGSESTTFAAYLRSQRTTTQDQVDQATKAHDADDFSAAERFSSVSGH